MAFEESQFSTNVMKRFYDSLAVRSLAGSRASVIEENGKTYVVIDGRKVDANDLFGVNNSYRINKSNINEWLEKLVAEYDKKMAENTEEVNFLEKMENSIKAAIKQVKESIRGILAMCNATSIGQIADKAKKNEALDLYEQKWDLTFEGTGVNNKIHNRLSSNRSLAFDKGDAVRQIGFNNAVASRLEYLS